MEELMELLEHVQKRLYAQQCLVKEDEEEIKIWNVRVEVLNSIGKIAEIIAWRKSKKD